MRTVFEILPSSLDPENSTLLCEVNNEGFSFCVKEDSENFISALGIYHYDKSKPLVGLPIDLQIIFHQKEIFRKKFRTVKVVYSLPQSVLIPFEMYQRENNTDIMNMIYGDLYHNETVFTDVIPSYLFYNCYRIPEALHEIVQSHFPEAVFVHQHTLLLKESDASIEKLSVIFYTNKFVVTLVKNGKIQLVNSYHYNSPEDVSYMLLNICTQFQIDNIPVEINGLVEENSPLYKEVYNFFEDIKLAQLPENCTYSEEITRYPSHYFSNIFAIDSCE